jgi:autotransporter-associated beta strand protein
VGFSDASAALVLNGPAATNSISITANTKGWTNLAFTAAQAGVLEFNFSVAPGTTVSPLEITGLADFTAPPAVSVIFTSGSAAGTYPLMTWGSTSGNNPALAPLTIIGAPPTSTLSTNNNTLYVTIPVNVKANNTLDLTNAASWTANWVPTSFEAAIWDNTVLGANTTALGADTTWGGIQIKDPGGLVTINAGNTLTLGAASTDINMTNATADLTLNCNVALGAANVWDVTNSRTLTVAGVISSSSTLTKQGAGTVTLTGANTYTNSTTVTAGQLNINNRAATNMGTLNVVGLLAGDLATVGIGGGTLNFTPGRINVGGQGGGVGDGAINQTGGTVTFTGGDMVVIAGGGAANPKGTYNLSGGSIDATGVAGGIANRGVLVGANATGTGVFNLSGTGSLLLGTNIVHVARGDGSPANGSTMSGTFNQTGGTAQMGFLSIGGSSVAANKTTNVQAYVNLNGGTFVATNFVRLANGGGDTNAMLIGGTADVTLPAFPLARGPGSTNTLTLDGGTLRPLAASASYLQAGTFDNAYVTTNGAHLAVASGNDITVGQVLQDAPAQAGELTKSGAGILTLTGTNTYTGTTTISAGTLKLANDAAINLTSGLSIAAGGTLDTVALTGPPPATIPLTASGTGTTVGTTAAAIIGVSGFPHDLSSRPLILNYDGANPAVYLSGGTLNLNNNPFTINGSVLANGVYTIIAQSDAPAITGSVATSTVNGTALTGKFGTVSLSGNTVVLTVSDGSAPQPTIAPVTVSGTNLVLSVPTTSGYNYVLQSTTNLTPAITWMNESTNAGTGGNLILNVPIDPDKPQRFLRFWVY